MDKKIISIKGLILRFDDSSFISQSEYESIFSKFTDLLEDEGFSFVGRSELLTEEEYEDRTYE